MVFNAGIYIYTVNCKYDLGEDSAKDATVWWGCILLPQIITSFNPSTPSRRSQNQNYAKFQYCESYFVNTEEMKRQMVPCESTFKEVSFKWSNSTIWSTDQEVITPITRCGLMTNGTIWCTTPVVPPTKWRGLSERKLIITLLVKPACKESSVQ